jgi:probable F420-dependent oxidoreductase
LNAQMPTMNFGLFDINQGACLDPAVLIRTVQQAELAGLESAWAGEHVVLPDPRVPPSPMEPTEPILDPIVALTFAAAVTTTLRLGTGVIILPQRNPLVLAKELASLDVLAKGRLIFGLGVGYLEPEFRALGVELKDHGPRSDDYLGAMRSIWSDERPGFEGRFVRFSGVNAYPRPLQQPTPSLVVGGHSVAAYRRAVRQAHGWYGFGMTLEQTAAALADLRAEARHWERPTDLGQLEISITPPRGVVTRDVARQYADLGVDRLILRPPQRGDAQAYERCVAQIGDELVNRV